MYTIFNIITKVFDAILFPFKNLAPVWGVAFLAFLSALFILYIYKRVSNQNAIKRLKKRIQGYFLGIYLFRDDLSLILGSQARVFSNVFRYLGHSLLPLAVVIVPILLVCVQMQLRYGYSNLRPGDRLLVSAVLERRPGGGADAELLTSDGLTAETPPLRIAALNEVDWRIKVDAPGEHKITVKVGGAEVDKTVAAVKAIERLYPAREKSPLISALIYPGERPINKQSPVQRVTVNYPHATVSLFGLHLHWSIVYFLLAIVFGIILKRFFKVEF